MKPVPGASHEVSEFIDRLEFLGLLEEIETYIRRKYGVQVSELIARDRHKHVSDARAWSMHFVRNRLDWSYPAIGRLFRRDQSTAREACVKMETLLNQTKV